MKVNHYSDEYYLYSPTTQQLHLPPSKTHRYAMLMSWVSTETGEIQERVAYWGESFREVESKGERLRSACQAGQSDLIATRLNIVGTNFHVDVRAAVRDKKMRIPQSVIDTRERGKAPRPSTN